MQKRGIYGRTLKDNVRKRTKKGSHVPRDCNSTLIKSSGPLPSLARRSASLVSFFCRPVSLVSRARKRHSFSDLSQRGPIVVPPARLTWVHQYWQQMRYPLRCTPCQQRQSRKGCEWYLSQTGPRFPASLPLKWSTKMAELSLGGALGEPCSNARRLVHTPARC